jgi:hypothetical protein
MDSYNIVQSGEIFETDAASSMFRYTAQLRKAT